MGFLSVGFWVPWATHASDQNRLLPTAEKEIEFLLTSLEATECQFERNGKRFNGKEAESHLRKKLNHGLKRGKIHTAEEFITYAATESSMSQKPYLVLCPDRKTIPSSQWMSLRLAEFRMPTHKVPAMENPDSLQSVGN
jgi:hypothetical protein